jgi:hypothetical protein
MTNKKVFGYIFIVVAVILTLAIVGQVSQLFGAILDFFKVFTGTLDGHQVGQVVGALVYWIFHFALTISLWIYGRRCIRNK